MKKSQALKHFGTQIALAKALGVSRQRVCNWKDLIPEAMAYRLQAATDGKLKVNPKVYQK